MNRPKYANRYTELWSELRGIMFDYVDIFPRVDHPNDLPPSMSGIYFVCDEASVVIYVGKAVDIKNRWKRHALRQDVIARPWHIRYKGCDYEYFSCLEHEEAAWIAILTPKFNRSIRTTIGPGDHGYSPLKPCIPNTVDVRVETWCAEQEQGQAEGGGFQL